MCREVPAAPDQEGVDRVHERDPHEHERNPRLEVDPAEHRPEHQDRCDPREHELEVHERGHREVERGAFRDRRDDRLALLRSRREHRPRLTPEGVEEAFSVADRRAEAHLEAPQDPGDEHETEGDEREHHAVHRPARPGKLISPTNVAAVICHALSPAFSQLGYASQDMCLRFLRLDWGTRPPPHERAPRTNDSGAYEIRLSPTPVGPPWPTLPPRLSTFV